MKMSIAIVLAAVLATTACATRRASTGSSATAPRLTSSAVIFETLQDGKDNGSAVTAQLLRPGNEVGAEGRFVGTKFDDNSTSPPLSMMVIGSFTNADAQEASLRLRLTPEGRDTWTFNIRLTLTFADNTQQAYIWKAVRLDENTTERTLTLSGARI